LEPRAWNGEQASGSSPVFASGLVNDLRVKKAPCQFDNSVDWLLRTPIAHRGLHRGAEVPENSLPAFERAARAGYPIELDVHLTVDGEVVVFHDHDLHRLTGQHGSIAELDIAAVRELRLLGSSEPVPLLNQVLKAVAGQVPLVIEVKEGPGPVGDLEAAVLKEMETYHGLFAIQSFNPWSLAYFHECAPHIVRGQLSCEYKDSNLSLARREALKNLRLNDKSQPHYIAYDIGALPSRSVSRVRASGIPLIAWTIRTPEEQQRARELADNYIFEGIVP
jgi:glycerophosphoryl diester phosphodiesterase